MCREFLERLTIESRALKRAQYEAFSFEIVPAGVRVRNRSHPDPAAHEYVVDVEDGCRSRVPVRRTSTGRPACKHRLAVANREPVLAAATAATSEHRIADGGRPPTAPRAPADADEELPVPEDCACEGFPDGVPCWPCYRIGRTTFDD